MPIKTKSDIIQYYYDAEIDYKLLWHLRRKRAMHYGFWGKGVRSLPQALSYENKVLAHLAGITHSDRVLDAGCGVGGSSLYLAEHIGCHVVGISIVDRQIDSARQAAKERGLDHLTTFQLADYTATDFTNQSFDVVWAIESVCYATEKADFINEAFRLLKPGGRLIVADGFATQKHYVGENEQIMRYFLDGMSVAAIDTLDEFTNKVSAAGFQKVQAADYTKAATPSAKIMYSYTFLTGSADWMTRKIGWRNDINRRNFLAARYQYKALRKNLWRYGVVTAVKPAA